MGFKSSLNLGLKIGTKLVQSLAEKSLYFCELLGGVLCFLPSTHYPLYDFDLRATHARTLLPAALASVSFGFVLVRVRVRGGGGGGGLNLTLNLT